MPAAEVGSNQAPDAADLGAALAALENCQPGSFKRRSYDVDALLSPLLLVLLEGPDPALRGGHAVHSADDRNTQAAAAWKQRWPIARFPVLVESRAG